jgi:hypothetical protein
MEFKAWMFLAHAMNIQIVVEDRRTEPGLSTFPMACFAVNKSGPLFERGATTIFS